MDGVGGKAGWGSVQAMALTYMAFFFFFCLRFELRRWVYIIEGFCSLACCILIFFGVPNDPSTGVSGSESPEKTYKKANLIKLLPVRRTEMDDESSKPAAPAVHGK